MEEQAREPRPAPRRAVPKRFLERLTRLETRLTGLLAAVDHEAKVMDDNLEQAHKLVEDIRELVKGKIFGESGLLDSSAYEDVREWFEDARTAENQMHEVYAYVLERHREREMDSLSVAAADEDKLAQVLRRAAYIQKLREFHDQFSAVLGYLRMR